MQGTTTRKGSNAVWKIKMSACRVSLILYFGFSKALCQIGPKSAYLKGNEPWLLPSKGGEDPASYSRPVRHLDKEAVAEFPDQPKVEEEPDDDHAWNDYLNVLFDPVFDPDASSNVSYVLGQMAHLPCRVNNLGTKTVSWIRHHDTHILTVGSFTYTGDTRFSALHREGTNEWTLQIKNPTLNDSGLYECQVSTKPVKAYLVRLDVVVPTTKILHAPELHTNEGGVLNLTCVVSPSPAPPEFIFWYHKEEVINYETEENVLVAIRQEGDKAISSLVVAPANLNHSGVYSCEPSNSETDSIIVHVFKAEEPAARKTNDGISSTKTYSLHLLNVMFLLLTCGIYTHITRIYFLLGIQ